MPGKCTICHGDHYARDCEEYMDELKIEVVFDGPPGPNGGRFVEVEINGASVSLGAWVQRSDGRWALTFGRGEVDRMIRIFAKR